MELGIGIDMKVVYGHTDSIYVQIDDVDKAKKAIKVIEDEVRKSFPNVLGLEQHPVVLEFEKFYSALGVGTTKNRNAGLITWDDGIYLDKPKFTMTGFTAKRVSETKLAKETQTDVLKMWVENKSEGEIVKHLHTIYENVLKGNVELSAITKKSRLKQQRFKVFCPNCRKQFDMREELPLDSHIKRVENGIPEFCDTHKKYFVGQQAEKYDKKLGKKVKYNKRVSVASGVAGIMYALQNKEMKFEDSYVFIRTSDNLTFKHPLTDEEKPADYVAGITFEDLASYTPDYEYYAEQVKKKAEPVFNAMGWDLTAIKSGNIQKTLEEWF